MQGCIWYNARGEEAFYSDPNNPNLPDPKNSFGMVDIGYMVDVVGVTNTEPEYQWVKFVRKNDEGIPATLWMQRMTTDYARKPGTVHPHCVEIVNHGEAPVSPFSGDLAAGQVMCTVASPLFKDRDCTQKLRDVLPGELFWYDSESSGVLRSWYKAGGFDTKCYFKRVRPLDFAIGGLLDKIMLVGGAGAWESVPVLKPQPPEPEPEDPWWFKIAQWCYKFAWLEWLGDLIIQIFGQPM